MSKKDAYKFSIYNFSSVQREKINKNFYVASSKKEFYKIKFVKKNFYQCFHFGKRWCSIDKHK